MIKIVTALGDPNLNNELKKYDEFNVICKDIQYFDGILEILERNSDIDYLIISELLDEQFSLSDIIDRILKINRKIKIIAIIDEKNNQLEQELLLKGVHEIFFDGIEIYNIINLLKNKNIEFLNKELREEIESLKKIITNKSINKINNKLKKKVKIKSAR